MSKFIPTSKNNLCPICENSTGKCRQGREDLSYWQCMTYADAKKGDIIGDYKCLGQSKNGLWAQFRFDNSQEWTEEKRREWKQRNQDRQQKSVKDEEERRQRALKVEERHEQYTKLLSELTLHPEDKEDLIRRGFTESQIELSGFKSVEAYQQLRERYSELLAGISTGGRSLIVRNAGYLIPIRNIDGLIVACQIRLRALPAGENNRYRWLSTKKASAHIYTTGFNPKAELPLAVHRPEGKPVGLALAEGTGAKPFLTSQRFNQVVVGAAGGLFAASESIFKSCLESLSGELGGAKELTIYPDKGSTVDAGVMNRWRKTIDLLKQWDWSVKVAWWGQVDKTFPDIDELSEVERGLIKFISVVDFFKIAEKQHKELEKAKKVVEEARQREINDTRYASFTEVKEKPWRRVNTDKLNLAELALEAGYIYTIISSKNTGKTFGVAKPLTLESPNALVVTYLKSLGLESSKKLGIPWQDDIQINGVSKLGCTINSVYKVSPGILAKEESLFLMDEADQVLAQALEDICNKTGERMLILKAIEHHIRTAVSSGGMAVFMSADLTQKEIDLLRKICPDIPLRVIINDHKPPMGKLYFDESSKPDKLISKILERCKAGLPCFVVSDFKGTMRGCKSVAELIRSQCPGIRVQEINGDVTKHPAVIEFLKHVDEASKDIDLLICSPAVTSGISIENLHFIEGVFGIFFGILDVGKACQSLVRVRGAKSIYVWAANKAKGGKKEGGLTAPEEIRKHRYNNYSQNARHIQSFDTSNHYDPMSGEFLSPWFEYFCKVIAQSNLEKQDYRRRIKEKLTLEGYEFCDEEVTEEKPSATIIQALEKGYKEKSIAEAEIIEKAEVMNDTTYELYKQKSKEPESKLKPEEKEFLVSREADFKKTVLYHAYGEELISILNHEVKIPLPPEEQSEDGKTKKEPVKVSGYVAAALKGTDHFKTELENYHLLRSDISESAAKDWRKEFKQLETSGERFAGDVTWNARKKAARDFAKLPEFIDSYQDGTLISDDAIKSTASTVRSFADLFSEALGLKQLKNPKTKDAQIVGELLAQVGIKVCHKRDRKRGTYERWLDPESIALCEAYHQHKLRQKAEWEAKEEEKAQARAEATAAYSTIATAEKNQAAAVCGQATESNPVDELCVAVSSCESIAQFATIVKGFTQQQIEDAIALSDSQPRRRELAEWYQQLAQELVGGGGELAHEREQVEVQRDEDKTLALPSLESYQAGDQVWAYFPQSEAKWLKATVEWVRDRMVRVKSGFFGMLVEREGLIAPGHWVLKG